MQSVMYSIFLTIHNIFLLNIPCIYIVKLSGIHLYYMNNNLNLSAIIFNAVSVQDSIQIDNP